MLCRHLIQSTATPGIVDNKELKWLKGWLWRFSVADVREGLPQGNDGTWRENGRVRGGTSSQSQQSHCHSHKCQCCTLACEPVKQSAILIPRIIIIWLAFLSSWWVENALTGTLYVSPAINATTHQYYRYYYDPTAPSKVRKIDGCGPRIWFRV